MWLLWEGNLIQRIKRGWSSETQQVLSTPVEAPLYSQWPHGNFLFSQSFFYSVARYSNSWQLIRLFSLLRYRFLCMYFRTSSAAIYSRTVPLGDSNEYFDQIWFPSEPPGVALSGPLRCRRTSRGIRNTAEKTPLRPERPWPSDNPEFGGFLRARTLFPPPALARLAGGLWRLNHISRKGQSNLRRSSSSSSSRSPPPTRLPCHSADVMKHDCVHCRTAEIF